MTGRPQEPDIGEPGSGPAGLSWAASGRPPGSEPDRSPVPWHLRVEAPRPDVPRGSTAAMLRLHRLLAARPGWRVVARALEALPLLYRAFTWTEERVKRRLFGCRMCAQCALPVTAYACPMTCPKELRNGPCGGVRPDGGCEVYPDLRCVWLEAYERADRAGRLADLRRLLRPIDQRAWGRSSWVNYWLGRDDGLWTEPSPDPAPSVVRIVGERAA